MDRRTFLESIGKGSASVCLGARNLTAGTGLMERLGVTSDEITADFEAALKFIREFGLRWVEVRNLGNSYVTESSLDECRKAKALLDKYGVKLSVLDTALYKCNLPGTRTARRRSMRTARWPYWSRHREPG